jgi:hypothetical protein
MIFLVNFKKETRTISQIYTRQTEFFSPEKYPFACQKYDQIHQKRTQ